MSDSRVILSDRLEGPHGHYSHAVRAGSFLFVSGILGNNDERPPEELPDAEAQTLHCLQSLVTIVNDAGGSKQDIVKVSAFVRDLGLWPRVNRVYARFFDNVRPARIIVPCGPLRFGSLIELDAIAFISG